MSREQPHLKTTGPHEVVTLLLIRLTLGWRRGLRNHTRNHTAVLVHKTCCCRPHILGTGTILSRSWPSRSRQESGRMDIGSRFGLFH
jgi:hypothetical protein